MTGNPTSATSALRRASIESSIYRCRSFLQPPKGGATSAKLSPCGAPGCFDPECPIPVGYCHCRCGQRVLVAPKTSRRYGHVRGMPLRFLNGHYGRQPFVAQRLQGRPAVTFRTAAKARRVDPRVARLAMAEVESYAQHHRLSTLARELLYEAALTELSKPKRGKPEPSAEVEEENDGVPYVPEPPPLPGAEPPRPHVGSLARQRIKRAEDEQRRRVASLHRKEGGWR